MAPLSQLVPTPMSIASESPLGLQFQTVDAELAAIETEAEATRSILMRATLSPESAQTLALQLKTMDRKTAELQTRKEHLVARLVVMGGAQVIRRMQKLNQQITLKSTEVREARSALIQTVLKSEESARAETKLSKLEKELRTFEASRNRTIRSLLEKWASPL